MIILIYIANMGTKIFSVILIGMLLSVGSKQVFGQNLDLDSIFVILEGPFEDSEERVAELKKSAIEYLFSNPSISQQFSKKGLEISERMRYKKGMADAYNLLGIAEYEKGNFTNSITYYFKARDFYIELGDSIGIANTLMNTGNSLDHPDDLEKANDYYFQSIAIYKKLNHKIGLGRIYNNIGTNYKEMGQFDSALVFHNRSLMIRMELGDSMGLAATYNNIGLVYKHIGELDLALGYENSAQRIAMEIGYTKQQVLSYLNIGEIFLLKNEYQLAEYNFKQGLYLADSLGLKEWKADVLGRLSILEEKKGNYQAANNYLRQYMDLEIDIVKDQKSSEIEQLEVSYEIRGKDAECYKAMGFLAQLSDRLKESIDYYEKSITINPNYGAALNNSIRQYLDIGDFKGACKNLEKLSGIITENIYNIGRLNYHIGNYERAYKYLILDIERQKYVWNLNTLKDIMIRLGDVQGIHEVSKSLFTLTGNDNQLKNEKIYVSFLKENYHEVINDSDFIIDRGNVFINMMHMFSNWKVGESTLVKEQSLNAINNLLAKNNNTPDLIESKYVMVYLAFAYLMNDNINKALFYIEKAIDTGYLHDISKDIFLEPLFNHPRFQELVLKQKKKREEVMALVATYNFPEPEDL